MRNRAMTGPGATRMGGSGAKPIAPKTPMAGKLSGMTPGLGAAGPRKSPGGGGMGGDLGGGLGGGGMAPPMPGGRPTPPPAPPGGGGMGGSGGFAKGGPAKKFAKGGSVGIGRDMGGDSKPRVARQGKGD
jgi:hypothetical protein